MFEDIFRRKKLNRDKLTAYGFVRDGDAYLLKQNIMHNAFTLYVSIGENEAPDTRLVEKDTGEEYALYKTDAQGTFIGDVRAAIAHVLHKIADDCYETAVFQARQAQVLLAFVRENYGDEPEFLWSKFPDNAVWRRKDTAKWYGAILTVQGSKLGLDTDAVVEIVDLRLQPALMADLTAKEHYYPGWHMNKKSWYTMILDESIPDEELCQRVRDSYALARK
ncbi:MAG: MmcQ/YjbR family DNA-binding protein [Clostridia bacterium]|nr:MmcQ/YjbR family DNA-binding protein [Clostridia bacterium]